MVSAVVGGALSLIGGNQSANAAKDAASEQSAAANQANSQNWAMFQQQQKNLEPWLEAGQGGLTKLSDLLGTSKNTQAEGYGSLLKPFDMGDFQADPGYQFRLSEGQKALDRSGTSKGSYFSGNQLKAAQGFGQGLASEEFGNAYNRFTQNQNNIYNRLAGLSGTGQSSANQVNSLGGTAVANSSNLLTSGAAANAAGQVGAANAWNTGLQGAGSAFGSIMGSLAPQSPTGFQKLLWS